MQISFAGQALERDGWYLLGYGYRAYNPSVCRFHSPDSLSPFGDGGLNAYAYCGDDPVNRHDPSGHMNFLLNGLREVNILGGSNIFARNPFTSIFPGMGSFNIPRARLNKLYGIPKPSKASQGLIAGNGFIVNRFPGSTLSIDHGLIPNRFSVKGRIQTTTPQSTSNLPVLKDNIATVATAPAISSPGPLGRYVKKPTVPVSSVVPKHPALIAKLRRQKEEAIMESAVALLRKNSGL
jgi:RHS repeat-associated protein